MSWIASNSLGTQAEVLFSVEVKPFVILTAPSPAPFYYLIGKTLVVPFATGAFTTDRATTELWTYTINNPEASVFTPQTPPTDKSGVSI